MQSIRCDSEEDHDSSTAASYADDPMPREMPDSSERTMQDPRESELLWLQTENQRLTSENEVLHQINDKLRHVTEQRLSRASGAPTHEQSLQPSRGRHELCGWRPTLSPGASL